MAAVLDSGPMVQAASMRLSAEEVAISDLGACRIPSPLAERLGGRAMHYVGEADKVLLDDRLSSLGTDRRLIAELPAFELAGPRDRIFFDPASIRCGVVTCGGLCPGLNNVLRGIVWELWHGYGVRAILGFRFGFDGLAGARLAPMALDPDAVSDIHRLGGTVLGSARGKQDAVVMVDTLVSQQVSILFVIGGDGTMRWRAGHGRAGQVAVAWTSAWSACPRPSTTTSNTSTARSASRPPSRWRWTPSSARTPWRAGRAKVPAWSSSCGRHSGFIACQAALAAGDVSAVAIPEVALTLDGEQGPAGLPRRLGSARRGHAVVVIAEGAAEHLFGDDGARDDERKPRLRDVGVAVRDAIIASLVGRSRPANVKYIDPSYHIRSVPATPADSVYCWQMARNAVHAAMAGNTRMLIGRWQPTLRPRADGVGDAQAQTRRSQWRSVDVSGRVDRSARVVRLSAHQHLVLSARGSWRPRDALSRRPSADARQAGDVVAAWRSAGPRD